MKTVRDQLHMTVDKWLSIRDKQAIDIIISISLHAAMPGDPLWLILIKASGSAKTELLRSLNGIKYRYKEFVYCHLLSKTPTIVVEGCRNPRVSGAGDSLKQNNTPTVRSWEVYTLDSLTPHTIVSGLVGEKGANPSQLPCMNDHLVVIKDFSEVLSLNWNDQKRIFADLRQAYDGYLEKSFGSGADKRGGRAHFGLLAASTNAIDNFNIMTQELGERFLRIRLIIDEDAAVKKASEVAGLEVQMREELDEAFKEAVEYHLSNLDITSILSLPVPEIKMQALAKLTARLRSEVSRDRYRVIKVAPDPEIGTRLVKQFKALYRMSSVVLGAGDYGLVKRVGKDCLPPHRLSIINCMKSGNWMELKDIQEATKIPDRTLSEKLEDLCVLDIIEKLGDSPAWYYLTDRTLNFIREAEF